MVFSAFLPSQEVVAENQMIWHPLTPADIPAFVTCLKGYPLSMDDTVRKYPMQFYTLRIKSDDAEYVYVPEMLYMALDPIGPHDAVIHFVRDTRYRQKKRNYLDIGQKFILACFERYSLNRLTLAVVDGANDAFIIAQYLGFKHEGTMRKCRYINEKLYDIHIFGLLNSEV